MWVIARTIGWAILDNDTYAIAENDELWSGVELSFSARPVINIDSGNDVSRAKALELPSDAGAKITSTTTDAKHMFVVTLSR